MSLQEVHNWFGWVVVATNAVAGLWALTAHWYVKGRTRQMWWFAAAAQLTIGVQAVIGVMLTQVSETTPDNFHMFYGFVAFATVGLIYSYRPQVTQWQYLLYGLGGLFLMGLALRAMQFS